jgi:hypothetical protein
VERPADDRDPLLGVASSISDGTDVDWQNLRHEVDDETTKVLMQLAIVERIARVHAETRDWDSLQLRGTIGRGTSGIVYRAFDPDLEREIALKVLQFGFDPAAADRAVNEARMLARIKNPHVVSVFRAERHGDEIGLWMELIDGVTLEDLVRANGPLGAREAMLVGIDVCRALAAVHAAGLVHGDIKAHNVMREQGGRVVLMDFGAGKDLARVHDPVAGDFAGTPLYIAPEVFGGEARSKASDIYSLGVLLYYLVTSAYPVEGSSKTEIARRHERRRPTKRLRDARPNLPEAFVQSVEAALAEDPRERYRTAGDFEAALIDALPRSSRRRTVFMVAGVIGAAALSGIAWFAPRSTTAVPPADTVAATEPIPASAAPSAYQIDAGLYRAREGGAERLIAGARIATGDQLFLRIESTAPAHVYVVNEDERGESYLLFPLPGQGAGEPLAPGRSHVLPGVRDGEPLYWEVTSAGGREHFLVFANPQRLDAFEQLFARLPAPSANQLARATRLPSDAIGILRGVGGLAKAPAAEPTSLRLAQQFTAPLPDAPETANGLWVRRMTLENPK